MGFPGEDSFPKWDLLRCYKMLRLVLHLDPHEFGAKRLNLSLCLKTRKSLNPNNSGPSRRRSAILAEGGRSIAAGSCTSQCLTVSASSSSLTLSAIVHCFWPSTRPTHFVLSNVVRCEQGSSSRELSHSVAYIFLFEALP